MALFKCLQTGNTVEFDQEQDVRTMRQHPDYVEITEEEKPAAKPAKKSVVKSEEE